MSKELKSRVRLAVTPELIADATLGDSGHCMIAEAVKEALPWARHVSVDIQTIRYSDPSTRARYIFLTPRMAQDALVAFDAGEEIVPFRCELRSPHITTMQSHKDPKPRTEAQQARDEQLADRRRETLAKYRAPGSTTGARTTRGRAKMSKAPGATPGPNGGGGALPRITGGQPPPVGALASGKTGKVPAARRRQYGIRALDRGSQRGPATLLSDKGE